MISCSITLGYLGLYEDVLGPNHPGDLSVIAQPFLGCHVGKGLEGFWPQHRRWGTSSLPWWISPQPVWGSWQSSIQIFWIETYISMKHIFMRSSGLFCFPAGAKGGTGRQLLGSCSGPHYCSSEWARKLCWRMTECEGWEQLQRQETWPARWSWNRGLCALKEGSLPVNWAS